MKPVNIAYYFQTINDVISDTEEMGSKMHPYYESLRKAIDNQDEVSKEELAKVETIFEEGCDTYDTYQTKVETLQAPVKLMGLHKKFVKSYSDYVAACHAMLEAVNPEEGLNIEQFNQAEKEQDDHSQKVSQVVARMATLAMRK